MATSNGFDSGISRFVSAQDGLKLHVREYGARSAPGLPVVCIPGVARTVADFDALAPALANGAPKRRVIAIDLRGRGQSEHDKNPKNYNFHVELGDIISVLTALDVGPAILVGSSHGGLLVMRLGAVQPTAIAGVVLHDIGPVVEPKGIARIKGYVGKLPLPRSLEDAADIMRRLLNHQFPNLTTEEWMGAARRTWEITGTTLKLMYDPNVARALANIDIERPLAPMWNEFDALGRVPMLVVHGANSDMLSAATVAAMRTRRGKMESIEIADQGHMPLLIGDLLFKIAEFAAACDAASPFVRGERAGASALLRGETTSRPDSSGVRAGSAS